MKIKKILLIILLIAILICISILFLHSGKKKSGKQDEKLDIVVTNFSTYDILRQIGKDNINLTFLLEPGMDEHSYEPSASDIIKIQNSDIFIYIGGEVEKWSDKVIDSLDTSNIKLMCITEHVKLSKEKEINGVEENGHEEHEHEKGAFDEHIWSSPTKIIEISEKVTDILKEKDDNNANKYEKNKNKYIDEIENVKNEIQQVVDNKVRKRLIFGDRMPMQYFIEEFGLEVSAAFSGCSTDVEPSTSTVAYLINEINQEKIPVVLYIELSDGNLAKTIAKETNAEALRIQTMHNISKEDFENGETYISLMKRNLEVLKKALQ